MTAKEYLQQVYRLDRKINMIEIKKAEMRKSLYGRGVQTDSVNVKMSGDNTGIAAAIDKVIDYERQADELIDELVNKRLEIENTIANAVKDPAQREVLERRYLHFQAFEGYYDKAAEAYIKGIADEMHYTARHIYRLHGWALLNVSAYMSAHVSECQLEKC